MKNKKVQEEALSLAEKAMNLVCVSLPHLSGLASAVQLLPDERINSASICASGRLLFNPQWLTQMSLFDASFIMAHELMHLALKTHERSEGSEQAYYNIAHDLIINDILEQELEIPVPAGGIVQKGCSRYSAEEIVAQLKKEGEVSFIFWNRLSCSVIKRDNPMGDALRKAFGQKDSARIDTYKPEFDVITEEQEKKLFPKDKSDKIYKEATHIAEIAAKSNSLKVLQDKIEELAKPDPKGNEPGGEFSMEKALRSFYKPPWELALQNWMESVAPGPRSFSKASRRGADRSDVVLPGHKREGWMLHIILDTSGSMYDTFPIILGAIASFCDSTNITKVHILQCDTEVTVDEYIDTDKLSEYRIAGFGGSDMSPAMNFLALDPEVEAVIVVTDGFIDYPGNNMPYFVLWVIVDDYDFTPPYGQVLQLAVSKYSFSRKK